MPKMKLVNIRFPLRIISHCLILATGDDNTENETASPTKKAKGKGGRKAGQTKKAASKKDTDQEAENDTG